jgi:hypothetical protein
VFWWLFDGENNGDWAIFGEMFICIFVTVMDTLEK